MKPVTKKQIADDIIDRIDPHSASDVRKTVDELFTLIREQLIAGNPVKMHRIGTLKPYITREHNGVNPATGAKIVIPRSTRIKFVRSSKCKPSLEAMEKRK